MRLYGTIRKVAPQALTTYDEIGKATVEVRAMPDGPEKAAATKHLHELSVRALAQDFRLRHAAL